MLGESRTERRSGCMLTTNSLLLTSAVLGSRMPRDRLVWVVERVGRVSGSWVNRTKAETWNTAAEPGRHTLDARCSCCSQCVLALRVTRLVLLREVCAWGGRLVSCAAAMRWRVHEEARKDG